MTREKSSQFSQSVIHLLHRASQFADLQFEAAAREIGLTARQFAVLDAIAKRDEPSQADICIATGIDRSTMAEMVRRLIARRVILRRRSRKDARAYVLRLTEEGIRTHEAMLPMVGMAEKTIIDTLPVRHQREFLDLLGKIAEIPLDSPSRRSARS